MTDIARIGFSAETADLADAKAKLDALVPSATRAAGAADKFNAAAAGVTTNTKGAATGIRSFAAAATGATVGADRLGKAALASGTAMGTVQRAAAGAATGIGSLYTAVVRVNPAIGQADAHIEAYKASLLGVPAAANGATSSIQRLGAAANDNINRLQSTPGNIAAQFQDIGVSAAGGMQPWLIAMQQGTQLSAAMSGGLGNVLKGFMQILSPVSILTIALVGLVAAGLQMVDWTQLAQDVLFGLADIMEQCSTAALYLGVALTIAFAPQIIGAIAKITVSIVTGLIPAIWGAVTALWALALANPFTAIVLALAATLAAAIYFRDELTQIFGFDIVGAVADTANEMIRWFAIGFNKVVTDAATMANAVVGIINGIAGFMGFEARLEGVDLSGALIDTTPGRNFIGEAVEGVGNLASRGADYLRSLAGGIGAGAEEPDTAGASGASGTTFADIIEGSQQEMRALRQAAAQIGVYGQELATMRHEQDLFNQAQDAGIRLNAAMTRELEDVAAALGAQEALNQRLQFMEDLNVAYGETLANIAAERGEVGLTGAALEAYRYEMDAIADARQQNIDLTPTEIALIREQARAVGDAAEKLRQYQDLTDFRTDMQESHEDNIWALGREAQQLGLTGAALEAHRYETELLNEARRAGVTLTETDILLIGKQAQEHALVTEKIRLQREEIEFQRETLKGLFSDMLNGLRQGQSLWEAFGNAVLNVVNRIMDRLLDLATDDLFAALTGNGSGGGLAGLLGGGGKGGGGGLLSSLGSLFGAASGTPAVGKKFAKGGVFNDGIYDSPTLFKFAKGGAFGMMGEAGAEAVMPLTRGPDGSLGVQVYESQPIRVEIAVNDDRFNAYVDERSTGVVAQNAPDIANAGASLGNKRGAFRNSRRLA